MTDLMIKMTFWLVAAMLLGFIVAWFLSRIIYKRKQNSIENMFDTVIVERNNTIDELEKNFRNKREIFEAVSNELENSKEALAEKTLHIKTLQNRLDNSSSNENINLELKGFEEVLVLAEDRIEKLNEEMEYLTLENQKDKKSIKLYEKNIKTLEEELKLYKAEKLDAEFIISKDQFVKIEEQLKIYQKEIRYLKNANSELLVKLQRKDTRLKV